MFVAISDCAHNNYCKCILACSANFMCEFVLIDFMLYPPCKKLAFVVYFYISLHLDLSIWQSKWTHLPDPLCSCWKAFIVSAAFNCNGKCCYGAIKILHNSQKLKYIFHLLKQQVYWLNMQWLVVGENTESAFTPIKSAFFGAF